jgi:hypothetical protein
MNAVSNKIKPKEEPQAPKPNKVFIRFLFLCAILVILVICAQIETYVRTIRHFWNFGGKNH